MNRTSPRLPLAVSAYAAAIAAAAPALAQCSIFRTNIPDFDQVREPASGIVGLPGNGGMYCVPTSMVNWMAYIANHGVPQTMDGPRNWQSQSNYNFVSIKLLEMGLEMGTTADGGTGGEGGYQGIVDYLDFWAPGLFEVEAFGAWESYAPSPYELRDKVAAGGLVSFAYGGYTMIGGAWYREGGHAVTLHGIGGLCNGTEVIHWMDPASGGPSPTTQSTFAAQTSEVDTVTGSFSIGGGQFQTRTMWELEDLGTGRFIDGYAVVWPGELLTADPQTLILRRDILQVLANQIGGTGGTIPIPSTTPVADIDSHPQRGTAFVQHARGGNTPGRLWRVALSTSEFVPLLDLPDPGPICTGRFGALYACDGSVLKWLDPACTPACVRANLLLPYRPDAMAYDDTTDEIVVLNLALRRVVRVPHTLETPPGGLHDASIEGTAVLGGIPCIATHPRTGVLWVSSSQSPSIYELLPAAGAPDRLVVARSVTPPQGTTPVRGLNVDRLGHLIYHGGDGVLHELAEGAGGWGPFPGSVWAGRQVGPFVKLSRGRTNRRPGMDGPEPFNLLDPPQSSRPEVPVCRVDIDEDDTVTSSDISAFLGLWVRNVSAGGLDTDVNDDGLVNSADISAFLTDWLRAVTGQCNP